MRAKHTSAPWQVVKSGMWEEAVCSDGHTPMWIARKADESLANARLIAAAPDLLEALQAIPSSDIYPHPEAECAAIALWWSDTALPAIAKATGDES